MANPSPRPAAPSSASQTQAREPAAAPLDPTPLTREQSDWIDRWNALCAERAERSKRVHADRLVIDPNLMQSVFSR